MNPSEIRALCKLMDRMDYYRLLRIERGTPSPQVREAFHRARRQFHPDAFLDADDELRTIVDQIARRVTEAYMTLRDASKRKAYDVGLDQGELRYSHQRRADAATEGGRTPNGKRFWTQAKAEERAGNLDRAISHLKMALTFERDNESFHALLESLEKRAAG